MSREAVATALDEAAEALARAAHALRGMEPAPVAVPEAGEGVPPRPTPAPAAHPAVAPQVQRAQAKAAESAFTRCPAHGTDLKASKHPGGPAYCTSKSDDPDPNWTNDRGYCRVDARNAGAWLRQHPQGPSSQPVDVDDIPF